ncbi:hypothetical protein EV193_10266 [Herbihabitans rhizosphaerae]|uniref:Uncharacterized protein n=1 Tax=Herbihabitans rhizosphaerae TaxID=1872711 RepID=A0A4Q7L301_9PSEU|nr:hypothetical protein [Herbihabitans rhizosphaerae]RZS43090.1 hypothetical protein EV193_10266 [Herbihabitans rhizosphaerae]
MPDGPKIDLTAVQAAERVVDDAVQQMEGVTKQILAQAGLSQAAMKAPAGQITASTFDDIGGGGRALAETLGQLRTDLGLLRQAALAGSDRASSAASRGAAGGGHPVAGGMQ